MNTCLSEVLVLRLVGVCETTVVIGLTTVQMYSFHWVLHHPLYVKAAGASEIFPEWLTNDYVNSSVETETYLTVHCQLSDLTFAYLLIQQGKYRMEVQQDIVSLGNILSPSCSSFSLLLLLLLRRSFCTVVQWVLQHKGIWQNYRRLSRHSGDQQIKASNDSTSTLLLHPSES